MSGWRFTLRAAPALRVDLRAATPHALAELSKAEVEHLGVGHGNALVPLAEFFTVAASADDAALVFDGDLSRFDRIGWQMEGGCVRVDGAVGHCVGAGMRGGAIVVRGHAGPLAACEMAGGSLTIEGDVGDFAASTLPGSMDGMRGGTFVVRGNAGARFADRMRRGSAIVFGDAGDFLASRLVAGTIALGGSAGAHVGYGMRRGSVIFAGAAAPPVPNATFVASSGEVDVYWRLLARDLARHGGPFEGLAGRHFDRHLGDLAVDGRGELIFAP